MASLLTHGFVAVQLARGARLGPPRGRAIGLALLCGLLPDIDLAGLAWNVPDESSWFHRGITHGLLFSAAVAAAAALGLRSSGWRKAFGVLFLVGVSHALLDAMGVAGPGVAFFAPFSRARFLLPVTPLTASPFGALDEPGKVWPWMLANEALVVWFPVIIAVGLLRGASPRRAAVAAGAWLVAGGLSVWAVPQLLGHRSPREISGLAAAPPVERPEQIPTEGLPDGGLVTRFGELQALGVFDRVLVPDADRPPWSSGFFPAWYGGIAGRWRDGPARLVWRTLSSVAPPEAAQAQGSRTAESSFGWSPAEKYDLAVGDPSFRATRYALARTHDARPRPRFSAGLCNGVAAASLAHPEPFREVEALGVDGRTVRFHPNDVKGLLAAAYMVTERTRVLSARCEAVAYDTGAQCSMNPAAFVLAVANRVGLARRSALVQVHPSVRWQYYAIASASLRVARGPYPAAGAAIAKELAGNVRELVDVDARLVLSSTVLASGPGDVPDPAAGEGAYQKVGVRELPFDWSATVALGPDGELVGGRWRGASGDGPDQLAFTDGPPAVEPGGFLTANPPIQLEVVLALAAASVSTSPARPVVDLKALCARVACSPPGS